jgi:hypothetical protein
LISSLSLFQKLNQQLWSKIFPPPYLCQILTLFCHSFNELKYTMDLSFLTQLHPTISFTFFYHLPFKNMFQPWVCVYNVLKNFIQESTIPSTWIDNQCQTVDKYMRNATVKLLNTLPATLTLHRQSSYIINFLKSCTW